MAIGTGILFIVIGATLRFGITAETPGLDLNVIGYILILAGAIGTIVGLMQTAIWSSSRREETVVRERPVETVVRDRPVEPHTHTAVREERTRI